MQLKKKTKQKIKEKRIGSKDKKNCIKETMRRQNEGVSLNFLLTVDSLKINLVWSSSFYGPGGI